MSPDAAVATDTATGPFRPPPRVPRPAGAAAGCRTILIDRGYRERGPDNPPDARVDTLTQAVDWITRHDAPPRHT